jgi:hypothetical protein
MKPILIGTAIGLLVAVFLPFLIYQELSWLHFINTTFYMIGALFTFSLLSFVIQKGFFDVTFRSFRKLVQMQHDSVEDEEIRPLSKTIMLPYRRAFIVGLILMSIMFISLYFYYH